MRYERSLKSALAQPRVPPGIERVPAGRAVLTFDDGPDSSPGATAAVLDALDAAGAKATFFLVGEQISKAPELAREICSQGHEVGVHGQRHFRHDQVPAAESVADVEAGFATAGDLIGAAPRFYRPPFGCLTPAASEACQGLGMEVAFWTTWGLDWEPLSGRRIARRVLRDLDDGVIVLLHDSARYAIRPSAAPTAESLEAIASSAADRRLELTTLVDACGVASSKGD